ncbi:hypothetical protein [Cyclobacterium amurskyense]|uniref:ABC transporter ATPase n=1 Tax=Cyclobacterium amurskyense TaxID=320787 RepID=A0A0H4PB98_9BACT|nr:hypothetical protein [Cyclobacterium amurskyense]AKP51484.1 hypothetical protein CA2015_2059 [Cyclobacterium amurskyense]|tara:strand:- start:2885 stop:3373 length:489 start_codon:yes stop_codon:yes gene_type:complete
MYVPFDEMPKDARIWVYQADRPFDEQEKTWIISKLVAFCNQWNTHGAQMPSSFDLKFDQFIILSVDESQLGASGCSIDSSVRIMREIEVKLNINLLDSGKVAYLEGENVRVAFLPDIKKHVVEGSLQSNSKMFNPSVSKIADLNDQWLIEANKSWLKKYFAN